MENDSKEEDAAHGRSPATSVRGRGISVASDREQLKWVRWERFLPRRSLRVLLVEQDDSTRHIVAALLRKCSYHVAAVSDGMKAWEVMKEKSCSFDLVLTEVEMPSLSGISLLTKIVGAKECKNIPVIMMSSQDSVGVVLKCMLKGAADFLVKPVRKNELRNLWQHVWRRHCSSSYASASDNNFASNHISSNAADQSQTGENSDDHSDAKNLGSKPDGKIEIAENHAASVLAKEGSLVGGAEAHPEKTNNVTTLAVSSAVNDNMGLRDKTLLAGDVAVLPIQIPYEVENSRCTLYGEGNLCSLRSAKSDIGKPSLCSQINAPEESAENMVGFVESLANAQRSYAVTRTDAIKENGSSEAARSSQMKHVSDSSTSPLWGLSLKGSKLNGLIKHQFKAKCILNHSNASAFSRYGCKNASSGLKSNSSSICIRTTEYVDQLQSHVGCHGADSGKDSLFSPVGEGLVHLQMCADGSLKDVGSLLPLGAQTRDVCAGPNSSRDDITFYHAQLGFLPMLIPVSAIPYQSLCAEYGTVVGSIFYRDDCLIPRSPTAGENGTFQIHSDHSTHNEDHFSGHLRSVEFRYHDLNDPLPNRGRGNEAEAEAELRDLSSKHRDKFYQSDSYSKDILKSRDDGSGETTEAAAATGTALESCNESDVQNCGKNGTNSDRSRREAALIKFRLKRKDRCFEKKVRYHSRQKLADQRPRVKGQFVRQKFLENNTAEDAKG